MRKKRLISIVLAVGLLFSSAIPVLAVAGDDGSHIGAYKPVDSGEAVAVPLSSEYEDQSNSEAVKPASASDTWQFPFSQALPADPEKDEAANTIPPQPTADHASAFSAKLIFDADGYGVLGTVDFLPSDTKNILPMVSVDNMDYEELPDFSWVIDGTVSQICLREGESFERYLCGLEDALWLKLRVMLADDTQYETAPAQVIRERVPVSDKPPAFQAELKKNSEGYVVMGRFADFTPDTREIYALYSLDGKSYQPVVDRGEEPLTWHLGHPMNGGFSSLGYQSCVLIDMEPLKSYLRGTLEQFYIKLHISTWSGESYQTQSAMISRGEPQPPPEGSMIQLGYPSGMLAIVRPPIYGKYNVTAREGFAPDDLYELLPDTIPLVIKLVDARSTELDRIQMDSPAVWRLHEEKLSAVSDGQYIIEDAIEPPVIPEGQAFSMATGIYLPEQPPAFSPWESPEVRLIVNTIPVDGKADIALSGGSPGAESGTPMQLAFHEKPSGATSIRYFYYYDGMSDWEQAGDLMEQGMVDLQPGSKGSIRYDLFGRDEEPYRSYLSGQLDGFVVGVEIEGGVFDGEKHVLSWPQAYEMPPNVPKFEGSGGNENNVGGGDTGGGDSSGDGGQRPGLPDDGEPPTDGQDPEPSPEPSPRPDPEPLPTPTPKPDPEPTPIPKPDPEPLPSPNPAPEQSTEPTADSESTPAQQAPLPPLSDQHVVPVLALTPESSTPSAPQSLPQAAGDSKPDSPQESRSEESSTSSDPSAAPKASPQPTEKVVRTPGESKKFSPVAAATVVVVGVAATAAVVLATSAGSTAAAGTIVSKVFSALKRFFLRK